MIPKALLEKAKWLEIKSRIMSEEARASSQKSLFKGQGLEFSEHRTYVPGDDARAIDWKVSARLKEPVVKLFEEERERTILVFVDLGPSMDFGSRKRLKSELAKELGFVISAAASFGGDKFTLATFGTLASRKIPIRKGTAQLRQVAEILFGSGVSETHTSGQPKELSRVLDEILKGYPRRSEIFVISDFQGTSWEQSFVRLSYKHQIMPVVIEDPLENSLDAWVDASIRVRGPLSGSHGVVDPTQYAFRKWFKSWVDEKTQFRKQVFRKAGASPLYLSTKDDYWRALKHYLMTGVAHS